MSDDDDIKTPDTTATVPDAPVTDADKAILAETTGEELQRLGAEDRAWHEARRKELAHAQSLAEYAALHQKPLDADALKARNRRNLAIALALVAFVVLVFISSIVHMSGGATPQP